MGRSTAGPAVAPTAAELARPHMKTGAAPAPAISLPRTMWAQALILAALLATCRGANFETSAWGAGLR